MRREIIGILLNYFWNNAYWNNDAALRLVLWIKSAVRWNDLYTNRGWANQLAESNRNREASLILRNSRGIQHNSTFEVRYSDTKRKRDGRAGMSLVPADCDHLLARCTPRHQAEVLDYTA